MNLTSPGGASSARTARRLLPRLAAVALGLAEMLAVVGGCVMLAPPAAAQFWGDPFYQRPRPPRTIPQQDSPFGGFFQQGPAWEPARPQRAPRPSRAQMGDFSKAPAPRKPDAPPATTIVVMGDAMADWLGHGLEEAYADNSEFGVVRKIRANSGLIRNESRTDAYDWVHSAREFLAAEKPHFVVMMIGLSDRQAIRERPPARPASRPAQPGQQNQAPQQAQQKQPSAAGEQGQQAPPSEAPEAETKPGQPAAEPSTTTAATHEFRSEKWSDLYARRIDDTIAALKSKGVPVIWVGLPPIRGQRARTDLAYLNDLYRARAQKAGITYVDVWDGFVDEDGDFSLRGPDYNGQIRQLRSVDGIYFTKAGALKLGHYVEREIQRLMTARATPVALPAPEPQQPAPAAKPGGPAPRPVAGPVVPLTGTTSASEELAGSGPVARGTAADPLAARVLVRGEAAPAPSGRADDFSWPRADADDTIIIPAAVPPPPAPAAQPAKKAPASAEKGAAKRSGQASSNAPARPAR